MLFLTSNLSIFTVFSSLHVTRRLHLLVLVFTWVTVNHSNRVSELNSSWLSTEPRLNLSFYGILSLKYITYNGMTVCFYHVTYAFQTESTLYSCLNVRELLAQNRPEIWSLSDCNWTRTYNHLVRKRTLYHLAKAMHTN